VSVFNGSLKGFMPLAGEPSVWLYRIDDDAMTVTVLRIDHRADVYRS
jgi:hypothetical protein